MKQCQHRDEFGRCNQQVKYEVDTSEWTWEEWMTGRKTPFDPDTPEIIIQPFYKLKQTKLCCYHNKF
jgi:hypothetical protein